MQGASEGDLLDTFNKVAGFYVHYADDKVRFCDPCGSVSLHTMSMSPRLTELSHKSIACQLVNVCS